MLSYDKRRLKNTHVIFYISFFRLNFPWWRPTVCCRRNKGLQLDSLLSLLLACLSPIRRLSPAHISLLQTSERMAVHTVYIRNRALLPWETNHLRPTTDPCGNVHHAHGWIEIKTVITRRGIFPPSYSSSTLLFLIAFYFISFQFFFVLVSVKRTEQKKEAFHNVLFFCAIIYYIKRLGGQE